MIASLVSNKLPNVRDTVCEIIVSQNAPVLRQQLHLLPLFSALNDENLLSFKKSAVGLSAES
jgi:hypothetical protein